MRGDPEEIRVQEGAEVRGGAEVNAEVNAEG